VGDSAHRVTSVASSPDGSTTTIESYLQRFSFFDNAITSNGDVVIRPNTFVGGNVMYADTLDNKGEIDGEIINDSFGDWPLDTDLADDYLDDWDNDGAPGPDPLDDDWPDPILDLNDRPLIDPIYRDGDLEILNTGDEITSQLTGTIFVIGDLEFRQPPKAYTIDLNGQTIFVWGNITIPPQKVSFTGSGCIIAAGDITFQPGIEHEEDDDPTEIDFIFIFSINGTVWFAPQDDFNGSVAGNVDVNLQPNVDLTHEGDPYALNLNFPSELYELWSTRTWTITQS
jgi:hypothetical protein